MGEGARSPRVIVRSFTWGESTGAAVAAFAAPSATHTLAAVAASAANSSTRATREATSRDLPRMSALLDAGFVLSFLHSVRSIRD